MQQHGKHAPKSIDEAVERVLQFDRNWAGFDFPRYLMAVSRIQAEVLGQSDHEVGDYSFFASQVENHFEPAELTAMDEFGIPVQVGRKIVELVASDGELDRGIAKLRALDVDELDLEPIERQLLVDALHGI